MGKWKIFGIAAVMLNFATIGATSSQHANVTDDRIAIGNEYLPRRMDLPNKLIVPVGQSIEVPADATYDYIEVAGTLRVSRTHDTTLRFIHLVILPGGHLDAGTQADPIPCGRRVEFLVRDVPIDRTRDPFQWGNGLLNFGRQTRVGCEKTAWVESTGAITAGASAISLASSPAGWQIGDELLIPDTEQRSPGPRRESKVTIAAINGTQVTLSKPLDFAHGNIVDPNGAVVLRPRVANLTRNILIRSENPDGTRGHTADIGHSATWDVRYNHLTGLGRTTTAPLDETAGTHIGANQPGKYTAHHHHVQSSVGSDDVGNVYIGGRAAKWGLVVHGTSDTLVAGNIAVDFPGAGFVTEDGYEVRNVFRRNLAAYSQGNRMEAERNVVTKCPGCEGTGFWFRGIINTFERNEAWNNFTGMNLFNQSQLAGQYPNVPGGQPDTTIKSHLAKPVVMTDNVLAANEVGLEMWGTSRFPDENLVAAYNGRAQAFGVQSNAIDHWYRNPRLICRAGTGAVGIHSSLAYTGSFEIDRGGQIAGCAVGIARGGGVKFLNVTGTVLQNQVNIDLLPQFLRLENVTHVPLANFPHRYISFGDTDGKCNVWNGTDPLPRMGISVWIRQRGSQLVVKNWQGTGHDYLLFHRQQLGSNPAWYSARYQHAWNAPVQGLTMLESWERFGLSYGGDVLKDSEAVELDGLVCGMARAGLGITFPPPRAVVTFPTMREPAIIENGSVRITAINTGDPNAASDIMMASVDGERPFALGTSPYTAYPDDRSFNTNHISPGVHEIKVWRTEKARPTVAIPGSEYIAQYCVGACSSDR